TTHLAPALIKGSRYRRETSRGTSPSSQPSSASATSSGAAWPMTSVRVENDVIARGYAPDEIVPVVPSTPTAPPLAAATAARAPGKITPSTGLSSSTRNISSATALTVLQATTIALTPRRRSTRAQPTAYLTTVSAERVP